MNQRNEEGLFGILERELKKSKEPLDCIDLYNKSMEIREHASSPNRVSDYLGNMWRKGLLLRVPAPKGSGKTRWCYAWKGKQLEKPDMSRAIAFDAEVHKLLNRPNLQIEEDGRRVVITLPSLTITIEQKEE